jgi:glycine/D-amino acid oxidase-like deaminating enzyme
MKLNVVVVGAGVLGSYLSYELVSRGAAVTTIDAGEVASGSSSASYAWVNSHDKQPETYGRLNFLGLEAHERALRSPVRGDWFHQTGNIDIAQSEQQLEQLTEKVERMAVHYRATMLTRAEVAELEPHLRVDTVVAGAHFAREGWIDTVAMCGALMHRASGLGAAFMPFHRVLEVTDRGVAASGPDGAIRRLDADVVVVAAGNGTRQLLSDASFTFPLLDPDQKGASGEPSPTVGLISTTRPVARGPRHMIYAEGIAIRPARNGGITFTDEPTGGRWDHTDPRTWSVPGELLKRAELLYPALATTTETVVLGSRVLPRDGLTIADWVDGDRRVYAVATHSGVTLAAHLAQAVSGEILEGVRHPSLADFGLARFLSPA